MKSVSSKVMHLYNNQLITAVLPTVFVYYTQILKTSFFNYYSYTFPPQNRKSVVFYLHFYRKSVILD